MKYRNNKILAIGLFAIILSIGTYVYLNTPINTKQHLIVSTTTSLYETGLLNVLKTEFEQQYPEINVSFISQGTGLAIQTAMRGDADIILVHDPARELTFLKDGYGVNRKIITYNFFVIVGPSDDPAEVKGLSPTNALLKIKELGDAKSAIWVSRGDDSGTHSKEKSLWKDAGLNATELSEHEWYLEAGSGMSATLNLANEKEAYTLTDLATYLTNFKNGNINLEVLAENGKETLNVYSAIVNNPQKNNVPNANFNASMFFINFLVSKETQNIIENFGEDTYGKPLFSNYKDLIKSNSNHELIQWIQNIAFFDGTECPIEYRYKDGGIYQMNSIHNNILN